VTQKADLFTNNSKKGTNFAEGGITMKKIFLTIAAVISMLIAVLGLFTGVVLAVSDSPIWVLLALPYPAAVMLVERILK